MVTARGCSSVSGEGCCSWLRGRAALRNILEAARDTLNRSSRGGQRAVRGTRQRATEQLI